MNRRMAGLVIGMAAVFCSAAVAIAQEGAACACAGCACAEAGSVLSVTATGSVEIDPDRAVVSVGVVEEGDTAQSAMHAVNAKLAEAKAGIEALEIRGTRLSTSNVSVYPVFENRPRALRGEGEAPTIVGYRASNTLRVQIDDIERTGEVIDVSVKSGANQLQGVEFTTRDPFEAQTRALAEATMRAKTKANVMAGAMGATIRRVVSAQESGAAAPPSPRYARGETMMMSDMAPTPIEAGTLTVSASVSITYELSFE